MHVCISRLAKHVSNPVSLEARNNQVIELSEILATIVWSPGLPSCRPVPVCPSPPLRCFVSVPVPIYRQSLTMLRPSCNFDVRSLNGNFMRHALTASVFAVRSMLLRLPMTMRYRRRKIALCYLSLPPLPSPPFFYNSVNWNRRHESRIQFRDSEVGSVVYLGGRGLHTVPRVHVRDHLRRRITGNDFSPRYRDRKRDCGKNRENDRVAIDPSGLEIIIPCLTSRSSADRASNRRAGNPGPRSFLVGRASTGRELSARAIRQPRAYHSINP